MLNWLIDNWYILIGVIAILLVAIFAICKFLGLPTKTQITKIKEWLKYAVTIAEKDLGSKTGQLKLRKVYDMFITKFPMTAKFISFDTFSEWVDDALAWLNNQLESNDKVVELVQNESKTV